MSELKVWLACIVISIIIILIIMVGWASYVMPAIDRAAGSFAEHIVDGTR